MLGILGYARLQVTERHQRSEHGSCWRLTDTLWPNEEAQDASDQSLQRIASDGHAVFAWTFMSRAQGVLGYKIRPMFAIMSHRFACFRP